MNIEKRFMMKPIRCSCGEEMLVIADFENDSIKVFVEMEEVDGMFHFGTKHDQHDLTQNKEDEDPDEDEEEEEEEEEEEDGPPEPKPKKPATPRGEPKPCCGSLGSRHKKTCENAGKKKNSDGVVHECCGSRTGYRHKVGCPNGLGIHQDNRFDPSKSDKTEGTPNICEKCERPKDSHQTWCASYDGERPEPPKLAAGGVTDYKCMNGHKFKSNLEIGDTICPHCRIKEVEKIET